MTPSSRSNKRFVARCTAGHHIISYLSLGGKWKEIKRAYEGGLSAVRGITLPAG